MSFDAIIIGAGAAGLAAARDLSGAGKRLCILEARDRIGGRIWTIHQSDLPLPIELGAEFIHGEAQQTFAIVEAAALTAYELPDTHWWAARNKWHQEPNFWEKMIKLRKRIPAGAHDISFADFLKKQRSVPPRIKEMALMFVEGYHAAHADRISAAFLRPSDGEEEMQKQFRIADGYDALVEWLRAGLNPERCELRLGSDVTEISWKRGSVEVMTRRGEQFRAKAVIVTIPMVAPGPTLFTVIAYVLAVSDCAKFPA